MYNGVHKIVNLPILHNLELPNDISKMQIEFYIKDKTLKDKFC